nr:MAG TPA: metallo-beta-lactamase [Caudoviricetes sp.]
MRRLLTITCAIMMLSSCGALRKQIETVYVRDTTYISKVQVDSVFKRDSIFVKKKNDTVYVYKEKVRDRYRLLRDTVYQHSVDSVYVDKVREVKVEKQLNAWQKFRLHGFWVLAAMVGGYIIWKYRKQLFRALTKLVA